MNNDAFIRLNKLLTLLCNHPEGLSARDAARLTGYPAGVLLDDLNRMSEAVELAGFYPLYSDDDGLEVPAGNDELDARWYLAVSDPFPPLSLNVPEAAALLWLLDYCPPVEWVKDLRKKLGDVIGIEETAAAEHGSSILLSDSGKTDLSLERFKQLFAVRGNVAQCRTFQLDILREAVIHSEIVRMTYYARGEDELWTGIEVYPLGLVYFTGTGFWYLIGRRSLPGENMVFRLDRVKEVAMTGKKFSYPAGFTLHEFMAPRWGMDMSPPVRVKVRFYNEAGVLEKVRNEFQWRGLSGLQAEPGGTLLFAGDVYGLLNFSRWLLGFGSSVEVIAPEELRLRMIAVARYWRGYYPGR